MKVAKSWAEDCTNVGHVRQVVTATIVPEYRYDAFSPEILIT